MKQDGFFWDGYLHWARDIEAADPELVVTEGTRQMFEPIFVRMKRPIIPFGKMSEIFEQLREIAFEPRAPFRDRVLEIPRLSFLEPFAFDLVDLIIGLEHALAEKAPPEFFLYRPIAMTREMHLRCERFFTILDVGAPALVNPDPTLQAPDPPLDIFQRQVVGAVIDNDIGFLNRTFRSDTGTRFLGVWLQARERLKVTEPGELPEVLIGQILNSRDIDGLIRRYGRDERGAYRDLNESLHTRTAFKRAPHKAGHGAMVADLAVGNRGDDEADAVPLLGVQLPPDAARDTSGTTSESYIVQGVRWICFWARQLTPDAEVVINISYGVLAGQKDGGKFIEAQIGREIDLAARHYYQTVKVVFAYGNSRNMRQVADQVIARSDTLGLTWQILADNASPSFVEVRAVGEKDGKPTLGDLPNKVTVTLRSPMGDAICIQGSEGARAGSAVPPVSYDTGTETASPTEAARLYNVEARPFDAPHIHPGYTMAAVAPTRHRSYGLPTAEPGDWALEITNGTDAAIRVVCQIQRGDTAPGFGQGGRQSRFRGRLVRETVDGVSSVDVELPLTNSGTNSAYVNADVFLTAGAERNLFGTEVPAEYSGQGADWTFQREPDEWHVVDGASTRGVSVSGTYSGSRERLSGTSAAAALCSREVINGSL